MSSVKRKAQVIADLLGTWEELPPGVDRNGASACADRLEETETLRSIIGGIQSFVRAKPKTWKRRENLLKLARLLMLEASRNIGGRKNLPGRLTRRQVSRFVGMVTASDTFLRAVKVRRLRKPK